jgi:hypothetical protein
VIRPSAEMLQDMLRSATRVGSNHLKGEAAFLNKYFLHWCRYGKLLETLPQLLDNKEPYAPPNYIKNQPATTRCQTLEEIHNYRMTVHVADLLGNVSKRSVYSPEIEILHFNDKFKPWQWRLYPLHGWFWYWQQHARSLPDLFEEETTWHLFATPLAFFLLFFLTCRYYGMVLAHWLVATAQKLGRYLPFLSCLCCWCSASHHYGSSGPNIHRRKMEVVKRVGKTVVRVGSSCLLSGLVVILCPLLCWWTSLFPLNLHASTGWFLFMEWTVFSFWLLYGPYCLIFYLMGLSAQTGAPTLPMTTTNGITTASSTSTSAPLTSLGTGGFLHKKEKPKQGAGRGGGREGAERLFRLFDISTLPGIFVNTSLSYLFLLMFTFWLLLCGVEWESAYTRTCTLIIMAFIFIIYGLVWVRSVPNRLYELGAKVVWKKMPLSNSKSHHW